MKNREEGVIEVVSPVTGEIRYQAIAKIKGHYTWLGWWTTHAKAMQAYKRATQSQKS